MKYNTKVDIVYQTIRTDIERGLYLPGDKIVISRIAKQCDCSEIPVREALRRLESEKVIKLIPNKGAVVSSLTKNYLKQLFQLCKPGRVYRFPGKDQVTSSFFIVNAING